MFIAFSGLSGSGKNTVMDRLIKKHKNFHILTHSTATTRPQRSDDTQYNTYIYLTKEQFEQGIKDGIFIEYELVHDNYYGTLKEAFEVAILDKDNHYMRDIDVKGVQNLKKFFKGKSKMLSIFLDVPNEVIIQRLKNRGDSQEQIEKRLSRGELERSYKKYFDLVIDNYDIEKTIQIINEFILKEQMEIKWET